MKLVPPLRSLPMAVVLLAVSCQIEASTLVWVPLNLPGDGIGHSSVPLVVLFRAVDGKGGGRDGHRLLGQYPVVRPDNPYFVAPGLAEPGDGVDRFACGNITVDEHYLLAILPKRDGRRVDAGICPGDLLVAARIPCCACGRLGYGGAGLGQYDLGNNFGLEAGTGLRCCCGGGEGAFARVRPGKVPAEEKP